jgi:outer membrane protein TolC
VPAESAAIEATLLQRQQDEDELRTSIDVALARLAILAGRPVPVAAVAALPDLAAAAATARQRLPDLRARPEFEQFDRTRDRIGRQSDLAAAQVRPKLSAFGRAGYGRPGLDFISNEWQPYGLGGVRLLWNAWNWGATARETEAQSLQSLIVTQDEAAFSRGVAEAIAADAAAADRLERALAADRRIIELRSDVERAARVRLAEGVVDASDYLARNAELLQARFAQATHQVELAQARARLLTTLGLEVK